MQRRASLRSFLDACSVASRVGVAVGALVAVLTASAGCKDARTAVRPPPPTDIATGATNAQLLGPADSPHDRTPKSITPTPNPFDAPPPASSNADPLSPTRRPTEL
ncbi:MAG: hypothetical protein U0414_15990 [Polyangiaceae bacterium]